MISAKEWSFASAIVPGSSLTPKDKERALVDREIGEYFKNGGILTRREKSGAISFWVGPSVDKLQRITLQQRNALVKAREKVQ